MAVGGTSVAAAGLGGGSRRAFTLIELLIVVAMLGLLIALVMPTLSRARELALDATCRGNMRQLWETLYSSPSASMPQASGWVGLVQARGCSSILACPKDNPNAWACATAAGSGGVVAIQPPPSVVFNDMESDTLIRMFTEQEGYALPKDVTVNITQPGSYSSYGTAGVIPAGTAVNCTYLFFDPVGSGPPNGASSSGLITFTADIIGIICMDAQLDASDPVLGRAGTKYATGQPSRGFENGQELTSLSADRRTFNIQTFYSTFPGENVRILTLGGGASSYGMNNLVGQAVRPGQLLLVEYGKFIVDLTSQTPDDFDRWIAPRHLGRANGLMCDGSVTGLNPADIKPANNYGIWNP